MHSDTRFTVLCCAVGSGAVLCPCKPRYVCPFPPLRCGAVREPESRLWCAREVCPDPDGRLDMSDLFVEVVVVGTGPGGMAVSVMLEGWAPFLDGGNPHGTPLRSASTAMNIAAQHWPHP